MRILLIFTVISSICVAQKKQDEFSEGITQVISYSASGNSIDSLNKMRLKKVIIDHYLEAEPAFAKKLISLWVKDLETIIIKDFKELDVYANVAPTEWSEGTMVIAGGSKELYKDDPVALKSYEEAILKNSLHSATNTMQGLARLYLIEYDAKLEK